MGIKNSIKEFLKYKRLNYYVLLLSIITIICITLGTSLNHKVEGKTDNDDYKKKEQPVSLRNFIIAENQVKLCNKKKVKVQIVMKKGSYFDIDHTIPGGGTYDKNYQGKYEIRVLDKNNKRLSVFNLNKDWNYDNINFGGKFNILFSDYNGDNNPDFTIGTYGSSSINLYYLYTIDKSGKISRMVKESIADISKDFSIVFEHAKEDGEYRFLTYSWNNATGEEEHQFYQWNQKIKLFEPNDLSENINLKNDSSDSDTTLTMEELLELMKKDSLTLKDFGSFTNSMIEGYSDESLTIDMMFTLKYKGENYKLQVSYYKTNKKISGIWLTRETTKEMILLESDDTRYQTNKDLNTFLNTHTNMADYITYQLPDTLKDGKYNALIGDIGGNLFLQNGESPKCTDSAPIEWCSAGGVMFLKQESVIFKGGKLQSVEPLWNHSEFLGKSESIMELKEQAIIQEVSHDLYTAAEIEKAKEEGNPIPEAEQTSKVWYVFFAREDGDIAYALFLNEKYYDKNDVLTLARTVQFKENAFYR